MNRLFKFIGFMRKFFDSAAQHRVGPYAAQASFFVLLSLVPTFMFILSMLNIIIPYFVPLSYAEMIRQVYTFFPEPISTGIDNIILDILDRSSGLSIATAVTALWLASRGMVSLSQGINNVLTDGEIQGYLRTRIMSIFYMLIFTLLCAVTIVVLGFGTWIIKFLPATAVTEMLYNILHLRWGIVFVILTLFFTMFYWLMPKKRRPFKSLIPGAALAAVGWMVFTLGFSIYVKFSNSYASIYGSISYVVLAMLWLYFCMSILLYGAEVNYQLNLLKKT